jgi:hypothetical protein
MTAGIAIVGYPEIFNIDYSAAVDKAIPEIVHPFERAIEDFCGPEKSETGKIFSVRIQRDQHQHAGQFRRSQEVEILIRVSATILGEYSARHKRRFNAGIISASQCREVGVPKFRETSS